MFFLFYVSCVNSIYENPTSTKYQEAMYVLKHTFKRLNDATCRYTNIGRSNAQLGV